MIKEARKLINICKVHKLKLSIAESCTGGLICSSIVSIPFASAVFDFGITTYSNESKNKFLKIPKTTLTKHGAVSKKTAELMVISLLKVSKADFCIATTGIAGPSGGTKFKPVGLVYHSFLFRNKKVIVKKNIYKGNRNEIRKRAAKYCLEKSFDIIKSSV